MSDPRFECPRCTAVVYHDCRPPSYYRAMTRRVRLKLPRLRFQLAADREEERQRWAERALGPTPITQALEAALGDRALREVEEE